eukprot:TRINITY_DN69933_c0_g1_i1.p1 TRINITY_DN69933_c0_g1~~TRINITY_DN69933_c0_g1_i1.p1  ORF type:complete len:167 (+),score=19.28 TRINITY_DN69933_c0_g1_i1:76-501(+)
MAAIPTVHGKVLPITGDQGNEQPVDGVAVGEIVSGYTQAPNSSVPVPQAAQTSGQARPLRSDFQGYDSRFSDPVCLRCFGRSFTKFEVIGVLGFTTAIVLLLVAIVQLLLPSDDNDDKKSKSGRASGGPGGGMTDAGGGFG